MEEKKLKEKEEQKLKDNMLMLKLNNFVRFRPFLQRYSKEIKLSEEEIFQQNWARQHSNKLILFGIKNTHPLIQKKSKIVKKKIYLKGCNEDGVELKNLVSGKKKSNFFKKEK